VVVVLRVTAILVILLMLAACGNVVVSTFIVVATESPSAITPTLTASSPPATPTAPPTPSDRTPSAECINPLVDVLTLAYQSDPVACYGDAPLTVDAYLTGVGVIDGPCLYVEPAWLACGSWVELDVVRKTATTPSIILAYVSIYSPFFATIDPTAEPRDQFMGSNVRVTGHFDDPTARTCRYTAESGWPTAEFTASDLISGCRQLFVITTIVPFAA
jgi:hypothetical protein